MRHRDDIDDEARPSLSGACTRTAGLACATAGIVAIAAFAIGGNLLMTRLTGRAVVEQARICAASLVASSNGDLELAVERIRARYKPLVAVASLGVSGDFQWVGDPLPGYRKAASLALAGGDGPSAATVSINGERQTIWGVTVALNGSAAPSARKVLFLFQRRSRAYIWLRATAVFGCVVGIGSLVGLVSFRCWFIRRVISPLTSLGQSLTVRDTRDGRAPTLDPGEWRETGRIAGTLRRLCRGLAASEAAVRRIKFDSQYQLRNRERGFNRRLRRAEDRATLDPLTGVRNRTYLDANLMHVAATQQTRDEDLSVVMFDLDNFKLLNDTYGHTAGDDLLRCTGELLRATLRPTDHAIRYGGDEFLLILPGVGVKEARCITERILKLFAQSAGLIDVSKTVTLSAGVASRKADRCDDGWKLIAKADSALYAAKRAGKNTVAVSSAQRKQPA
ncbi:MAG: GGDEF domain-containing protein [Planctomycetota bacterium]